MNFLHNIKNLTELSMQWRKIEDLDGIAGIRWLCRNDLYYLLVKVCKRTDLLKPFFYERCREVEANPDGYLDLWAREHGKSSIITFGKTLQDILINPDITVGFFSENYTLAAKFLSQIKRELEENEVLKAVFPDILYSNPQSESPIWNGDGIVVKRRGNPKEPTVECQGLLSMKVGAHYDLMVYDDIITMKYRRMSGVIDPSSASITNSRIGCTRLSRTAEVLVPLAEEIWEPSLRWIGFLIPVMNSARLLPTRKTRKLPMQVDRVAA